VSDSTTPSVDPIKHAWNDVAESFSALGRSMRERYQSGADADPEAPANVDTATDRDIAGGAGSDGATARGSDPTAALREAFEQLLAAGRDFGERATGFARDEQVKTQAKNVGTTLNDALEATFDQIGKELRGFLKGQRGEVGDHEVVDTDASEPVLDTEADPASGTDDGPTSTRP